MILRIWRTGLDPANVAEYERFAEEVSKPMFEAHDGCHRVHFGRSGASAVVVTLWRDQEDVDRLEASGRYRETVERIRPLLAGEQSIETFHVHGG